MTEFKEEASSASILAERFIQLTSENVFLTGKAGTGKTTFLKKIRASALKKTLITAPTGIAALNAGGVTLHSMFQLPLGGFIPAFIPMLSVGEVKFETRSTIGRHFKFSGNRRKLIREAELLIIDEVSMLRADLLDVIDLALQQARKSRQPFGGIQVLFIGDMMQLPPVVKRQEWDILKQYYPSPFFFDAQVLRNHPPVYIELDKIYRQSDSEFTDLLNNIRYNSLTESDTARLNQHYQEGYQGKQEDGYIHLTTHNRDADEINHIELNRIPQNQEICPAEINGEFPSNIYPCEAELKLKIGAQVMYIKNDPTGGQRFYNGKIGKVEEIIPPYVIIRGEDGDRIQLEKYEWQNIRYRVNEENKQIEEEVIGTFLQFPLRLAWAITIHKSQGLTFDKAIIDIQKVFASGQAYVAISRLRSLSGLVLSSPISPNGVPYDPSLSRFEQQKEIQGNTDQLLQTQSKNYLKNFCLHAFDLSSMLRDWNTHVASYNKDEERSEKQQHYSWASDIKNEIRALEETATKFRNQLNQLIALEDIDKLNERMHAAISYFNPLLQKMNEKVLLHKLQMSQKSKTKQYVEELDELDSELSRVLLAFKKADLLIQFKRQPELDLNQAWNEISTLSWRSRIINEFKNSHIGYQEKTETRGERSRVKKNPKTEETKDNKPKKFKGQTYQMTLEAFENGQSIEQIAEARNLAISTITGHFRKLIAEEKLPLERLVSQEAIAHWTKFLEDNPETYVFGMQEHLNDLKSYRDLLFTHAWVERNKASAEKETVI
jgi:hypothetical protein